MRRGRVDLRVVVPAVIGWATAGVLVGCPRSGWWWCGIAAGLIGVAVVVGIAARRAGVGTAIVALTAVGAISAATVTAGAARHPEALDGVADGHRVAIEATVASVARAAGGDSAGDRVRFRVTASRVEVGGTRVVGRMPALIFAAPRDIQPRIGERVRLTGTVKTSAAADSVAFMVFSARWQHEAPPPAWLAWASGLREAFGEASARLPGNGGALLPGLAIGDESNVSTGLDDDMKASSLSHLTAVSGSNCAIIIAGLLGLGAAAGLSRRWRVALALVGLAAFVVLVTPSASVLRAAAMASVVVLGTALGRPARALPALALAVLALLMQNPWLARDYGFALSVLATAALLLLAAPLAARLERWMPRWLAIGLAVPLAAQLACQPVLVLLNPALPLYGVLANVLAAPAAPIATIVGLIGCLMIPVCAPLAVPLLWLAWVPSAWIAGVAHTAAKLPGSALPWPGGVLGLALAAVITGLVITAVARPPTRRWRRVRRAVAGGCALILVVAAAAQAGPTVAARSGLPRDWVVGLCDVGQGDAIVLKSEGRYALIDTGRDPDALSACLTTLGVRRLALLVLTHYDDDHVGAVSAVAAKTDEALVGAAPDGDASAERYLGELRRNGVTLHTAARGDEGALGALRWRVLWPYDTAPPSASSNENSVTLAVQGDGVRMLFLADLDRKAQDELLARGDVESVDVVKVAHHGSADQSDRLYDRLAARLALISCGADNRYGHPTAAALGLLRGAGSDIARTDLEGTVLVTSRDGRLGLWTARHTADADLWAPAQR